MTEPTPAWPVPSSSTTSRPLRHAAMRVADACAKVLHDFARR